MDLERFLSKIDDYSDADACWLWTGATDPNGYSAFRLHGRKVGGHRAALTLLKGRSLSSEDVVDHSCHVRNCVNPSHLRITDLVSNSARQLPRDRLKRCRGYGHPLVKANVVQRRDGRRQCRQCARRRNRQWMRQHRARHRDTPGGAAVTEVETGGRATLKQAAEGSPTRPWPVDLEQVAAVDAGMEPYEDLKAMHTDGTPYLAEVVGRLRGEVATLRRRLDALDGGTHRPDDR